MVYEVEPPPEDLNKLSEYVRRQFEKIAANMQMVAGIQLEELHKEPSKPRTGMVVLADGTDWNPGSGQGVYSYYASEWHKLLADLDDFSSVVFLTSDVSMNNTNNFFDGPSTASLPPGSYLIIAVASVTDTATAAVFSARIYDGTTVWIGDGLVSTAANNEVVFTLAALVTHSSATAYKFQCRDPTATTGKIKATSGAAGSATNKATCIIALRIK